ncbi:MAG TPA: hypothetical protein VMV10_21255 [Pirellulales bacterium]|nr:hypothetical protein [Pirellulales bacterium]
MISKALGWDVHRKFSQVSVQRRNEDGEIRVIERKRLEHADRDAMRGWLARIEAGTPVAMEGAFGWQWVADLLQELGLDPHLGHPPAIKVLAKNEAKGDRCDADRLGRFYLKGIFPHVSRRPQVNQNRWRCSGGRDHQAPSSLPPDPHPPSPLLCSQRNGIEENNPFAKKPVDQPLRFRDRVGAAHDAPPQRGPEPLEHEQPTRFPLAIVASYTPIPRGDPRPR